MTKTITLGNSYHRGIVGAKRTQREDPRQVTIDTPPTGEEIPVFDRGASGYQGEYERPLSEDAATAWLNRRGEFKRTQVNTVDPRANWNIRG